MTPIEYDTVYTIEMNFPPLAFLTQEETNDMFRDGRISGEYMESVICAQHNNIDRVYGQKDHDAKLHGGNIPVNGKTRIEIRTFTAQGTNLQPSGMIGKGRKFDPVEFMQKIETTDYIICDIRAFPKLAYIVKSGVALQKKFNKKISNPKVKIRTMESLIEV